MAQIHQRFKGFFDSSSQRNAPEYQKKEIIISEITSSSTTKDIVLEGWTFAVKKKLVAKDDIVNSIIYRE